jgi:WD40 repeat protein
MNHASLLVAILIVFAASASADAQPPITAMALAPDGEQLVVASQSGVFVHRSDATGTPRALDVELVQVHDLAFAPDGESLAVAGGLPSEYGEVVLVAWPSGSIRWRRTAHDETVYRVAWHPDGRSLAAASGDHQVSWLSAETGEMQSKFEGHSRPVLALTFLPDGRHLVSGGADHSLRIWDLQTARTLQRLDQHTGEVHDLALRPENPPGSLPWVASVGKDRTLRFWQPTIGRLVRFVRLPAVPLSVTWLDDGLHVAVGCDDGHVRTVNYESLTVIGDHDVVKGWVHEVASDERWRGTVAAGGSGGHWTLLQPVRDANR